MFVALTTSACATETKWVSANTGFEIPENELPGLEMDAAAGGAESAYRL